jgi:hypothetical protein
VVDDDMSERACGDMSVMLCSARSQISDIRWGGDEGNRMEMEMDMDTRQQRASGRERGRTISTGSTAATNPSHEKGRDRLQV